MPKFNVEIKLLPFLYEDIEAKTKEDAIKLAYDKLTSDLQASWAYECAEVKVTKKRTKK